MNHNRIPRIECKNVTENDSFDWGAWRTKLVIIFLTIILSHTINVR